MYVSVSNIILAIHPGTFNARWRSEILFELLAVEVNLNYSEDVVRRGAKTFRLDEHFLCMKKKEKLSEKVYSSKNIWRIPQIL